MLEKVDDGSMGFTPAVQLSFLNKKEQKWSLDACTGYAKRHGLFQCNEMVCTHTLYHEAWAGNLPIGIMELPEAVKRKHRINIWRQEALQSTGSGFESQREYLKYRGNHWIFVKKEGKIE